MKVLHATFAYLPESVGGTEVYVAALARELTRLGLETAVVVPLAGGGEGFREDLVEGIRVFRCPVELIGTVFAQWRPSVLHCHPLTGNDLLPWMDEARKQGVPVVCTYHTPTLSCLRGDLLERGQGICDGFMEAKRCGACVLESKGLPRAAARLVGHGPHLNSPRWLPRKVRSMLGIPGQCARKEAAWRALLERVTHWVAVSRWVGEVLRLNGVPPERVTLCRQGLCADSAIVVDRTSKRHRSDELLLGFLGRIHPDKGLHVLLDAIGRQPEARLALRIAGAPSGSDHDYYQTLRRRHAGDRRLSWLGPVTPPEVPRFLSELDLLVVPSIWLESGPMTVLEAWAAGTPVLGSRRGGISEWIEEFGGGLLFAPGDVLELGQTLLEIQGGRRTVPRVPQMVRTMQSVAVEMTDVYQTAADQGISRNSPSLLVKPNQA